MKGPFVFKSQTIGLSVEINNLPPTVQVEEDILLRRSSFHVSLVAIGKIMEKHSITDSNFEQSVLEDFENFTIDHEISFTQYLPEFRFVTQEERKSVVIMCEVLGLNEFFNLINRKYNSHIESPPTHVTLYTLQPDAGIFLTTQQDLGQFTKVINAPVELNLFGL